MQMVIANIYPDAAGRWKVWIILEPFLKLWMNEKRPVVVTLVVMKLILNMIVSIRVSIQPVTTIMTVSLYGVTAMWVWADAPTQSTKTIIPEMKLTAL